ncbi:MAG: DUF1580 domain-containing protein [Planctomycetota bacterium]
MSKCHEVSRGAIDVRREQILTFAEAAKVVGKWKGKSRVAFQTLHRWATRGCRGVALETLLIGGSRCTSMEALERFLHRVSSARSGLCDREASVGKRPQCGRLPEGDVDAVLRNSGIGEFGEEPL